MLAAVTARFLLLSLLSAWFMEVFTRNVQVENGFYE